MEKLYELAKLSEIKNYVRRTMLLDLVSEVGKDGFTQVIGRLTLSATENPSDESKLRIIPFEVMFIDKNSAKAIESVLAHLNAIPLKFGDAMFEEGFFEILSDNAEMSNDETKQ
jgi:hypothetical protein